MIYAVDVGSTLLRRGATAFAWCRVGDDGANPAASSCPRRLIQSIQAELEQGRSVALGFEAPLFIPVPGAEQQLSRSRQGEGNRSWSAPIGGYVAALGLQQVAWVLRELHANASRCRISVDPADWHGRHRSKGPLLFCWEAFVTGAAHTSHRGDAATAAMRFQDQQANLESDVTADSPLSLFGAAVLWSRWDTNPEWLHRPLVVMRPTEPWEGDEIIDLDL
jgi:hypothetical protein